MRIRNINFIFQNSRPLENKTAFKGLLFNKNGFNSDTFFFRDVEELEFISDYAKKHFPDGTPIYDYGCSIGEEAYSLAMVMSDGKSLDKKYKISCFDLNPEVIEIAKKGKHKVFNILYDREGYILDNITCKDEQLKYCNLFDKFFIPIGPDPELDDITDHRHLDVKNFMSFLYKDKNFKVSEDLASIVEFQVGDIKELENTSRNRDERPGIVIFKNAWYHLTGNNLVVRNDWHDKISKTLSGIIKQMGNVIPKNGILAIGSLARDHHFIGPVDEKVSTFIPSILSVIKPSPFHELLKVNGFKPIFYSNITGNRPLERTSDEFIFSKPAINEKIVPSIWIKVD